MVDIVDVDIVDVDIVDVDMNIWRFTTEVWNLSILGNEFT